MDVRLLSGILKKSCSLILIVKSSLDGGDDIQLSEISVPLEGNFKFKGEQH